MTSTEFVRRLLDVEKNYKTVYGWGTFGWPWNQAAMDRVAKQYPSFYTAAKQKQIGALCGKGYFAFDCVGLIKGILWGWSGNAAKAYGGATYASGGVPDIDANVMKNMCGGVSTDFSKIVPGEIVWMQGHIGVYIGDGKAVECTPSWKNGVQITAVTNIVRITALNGRKWTSHGKLPWVEYGAATTVANGSSAAISVGAKVRITGDTFATGERVSSWAKGGTHTVSKISGDRALLGATNGICSWVLLKDLQAV